MFQQPRPVKAMPVQRQQPIAIPNAVPAMPMVIVNLPMIIQCDAIQAFSSMNCFVIVQCFEALEAFTGIETPNRYVVHDAYMRPLLYAFENSNIFTSQFSKSGHNFNMMLHDVFGRPFMFAGRRNGCCSDNLLVEYPPGNILGYVQCGPCSSSFDAFVAGTREHFRIETPCCLSGCSNKKFPIIASNGSFIGAIVRLYPGFLMDNISDNDTYIVHFPPDMPVHLKLIFLASVFLIDFTYFEN